MKRIFVQSHQSSAGDSDSPARLDVYFTCDEEQFIWTPDWKRETIQLLLEAYRVMKLIRNQSVQAQPGEKPTTSSIEDEKAEQNPAEWDFLALKTGKALENRVSLSQIQKAALKYFDFSATPHPNSKINEEKLQAIYDWIMTLGEQPYTRTKKLVLVKKFVAAMAPPSHPLRNIAYSAAINNQKGYML